MKKYLLLAVAMLPLTLLAGGSPKIAVSWKNPDYTGNANFKHLLVLALNGKSANRAEFEDDLSAALDRPTQKAEASYIYMPRPDATPIDPNDLRALVREQKFDAILVARLTKHDTKTDYVPGTVYAPPYPYYATFYGYYNTLYPVIYTPGYMQTVKQAQVEVNYYSASAPDGQLVWTGTTNTFNADSAMKAIKNLVKVISKELEKQGIVPQEQKRSYQKPSEFRPTYRVSKEASDPSRVTDSTADDRSQTLR